MENIFQKLCQFYLNNEDKEDNEEFKNLVNEVNKDELNKIQKLVAKIRKNTKELGYGSDFDSYCVIFEDYINKKDDLSEEEKTNYLKVLVTLSKVYEIDLRDELKVYISDKKSVSQKEIFYRFCRYSLEPNDDVEEFNELQKLAKEQNVDFQEVQKNAIVFVEDIKKQIEKYQIEVTDNYFEAMFNDYLNKKSSFTNQEKAEYLRILLYLSEIYNLNLRERLIEEKKDKKIVVNEKINCLLDNDEVLRTMLVQRYDNCYFDIKALYLKSDKLTAKNDKYDYLKMQADLTYRLYSIFVDKIENYAFDDLNSAYANLVGENELDRLKNLNREEIYELLTLINKNEPVNYLIRKFKLTSNLYNFIVKSLEEATDIYSENVGTKEHNMFNVPLDDNDIVIYLSGPLFESNFIINEYIKGCALNNVNYELNIEQTDLTSNTYLYANKNDLTIKLDILDKIGEKHKDLIKTLAMPMKLSTIINNSYYGLSKRYVVNDNNYVLNYIDYFNYLSEVSYYRVLAKIVLSKIDDEKNKTIIEDFINLKNVTFNEQELRNLEEAKYNGVLFNVVKDLINQYIPSINNILSEYISSSSPKKTLVEEFRKSLMYLNNKCYNYDKNKQDNISLDKEVIEILNNYSGKE